MILKMVFLIFFVSYYYNFVIMILFRKSTNKNLKQRGIHNVKFNSNFC